MKHAVSPAPPSPAQVREQVEKILASRCFSTSETVRNLLRYLGAKLDEAPGQHPKEHDIAITLLGRGSDYDPRVDPVVRVQTTRLRAKLAEYYISEGAADSIYIEIPKGSYMVSGSWRHAIAEEPEPLPAPSVAPQTAPPPPAASPLRRLIPYLIAAALLLAAASIAWSLRPNPDAALQSFWKEFASPSSETIVVYSNPKLVGSSTTGMRIYDPLRDQGAVINGGYIMPEKSLPCTPSPPSSPASAAASGPAAPNCSPGTTPKRTASSSSAHRPTTSRSSNSPSPAAFASNPSVNPHARMQAASKTSALPRASPPSTAMKPKAPVKPSSPSSLLPSASTAITPPSSSPAIPPSAPKPRSNSSATPTACAS
ncbi:MAG: hypothetical protein U0R19_40920 [Bryobacteraceae bacterium]